MRKDNSTSDFRNSNLKVIVITGGVLSGLGKGTAAAAIGRLLLDGVRIIPMKCDGYLNYDPGTMNPIEHGEVFVLDDGGEVDMDFGHYERFLNISCKFDWNLTSGKIFYDVINKERKGDFLGKTIQIFPHIIDAIKERFYKVAEEENADVLMIEIGGTIGDIENSWFTEAVRQLKKEIQNIIYIHLSYVPWLDSVGELKTKPVQRDVATLRSLGINPDVLIARAKMPLTRKVKEKLALFCDVNHVISCHDIETIYEIPIVFEKQGLSEIIRKRLGLENKTNLEKWKKLVQNIKTPINEVTVAICGKYTELQDSYASVIEALTHAGANLDTRVHLRWVETTQIESGDLTSGEALKGVQGVLVPGGFGTRGAEGKVELIRYARENKIPFLGLCFGLQQAVIDYARNVCRIEGANSTEVDPNTKHPVIDILPNQKAVKKKGGTMRLGAYQADVKEGSLINQLYGSTKVSERHRHRFEVNPKYHNILEENGLVISGTSENGKLAEFIELPSHPFFAGTQAHPELKSKLEHPAPLFYGFVKAALEQKKKKKK